jgi:hypothetical protein
MSRDNVSGEREERVVRAFIGVHNMFPSKDSAATNFNRADFY